MENQNLSKTYTEEEQLAGAEEFYKEQGIDMPPEEITTAIEEEKKSLDAYYDTGRKEYLIKNPAGRWLSLPVASMKRRLKSMGYSPRAGDTISDVDRFLIETEDFHDVSYAAPLAGKMAGFYEHFGTRYLVTESPVFIQSAPGDWRIIREFIENLFSSNEKTEIGECQLSTFYGWIKMSIESLRSGSSRHGQALAVAGEANCGKSFLQHHIITPCLGGREAKGARYMMGKTDFNGELFRAEHVTLEDEFMSTRITDRNALGASIKNFTVSTDNVSCHFKGRDAVNLAPWWRVSISLNDNPESLMVLPPLVDGVKDKIIILRGSRFPMPIDTKTTEGRNAFRERIQKEMPAFIYWIENEHQIAEKYQSDRYGVETWHHPALVADLADLAPEAGLIELIDSVLWSNLADSWTGTPLELKNRLIEEPGAIGREATKLLDGYRNKTGLYLGRLAEIHPKRFTHKKINGDRVWQITK